MNPFVVPENVASASERDSARRRFGLPKDAFVVGNAGWLIARKRWDVFLRVACEVSRRTSDAHFVIAGDGPDRSRLEALAKKLGIESKVTWLGWQSNTAQVYSSLDVVLFNSDWDALGRTPIEAVVHGVSHQ